MNEQYNKLGYLVLRELYKESELVDLHEVLQIYHESWKVKNQEFYSDKGINSAYLTGTEHLKSEQRNVLFNFIGSTKLMDVVSLMLPNQPCFMGTQLFFNPFNPQQKNYWHRDAQYHLSIKEQEQALSGPQVIHFRIPLTDEPGLELIPKSHKRWDTEEELEVRLEQNGHHNHENLSTGASIELQKGDLLIFSANMIHRGLYGKDRFAFDILFCDPDQEILKFVEKDCLPCSDTIAELEDASAFINTIQIKTKSANS